MSLPAETVASGAVSLVCVYAASVKTVNASSLRTMLRELGLRRTWITVSSFLIPSIEVVVGVSIVMAPAAPFTMSAIVVAAAAMTAAGIRGITSRTRIACACLSSTSGASLGWPQLLGAGVLLSLGYMQWTQTGQHGFEESLLTLFVVCTVVAAIHAVVLLTLLVRVARYRRATMSAFPA